MVKCTGLVQSLAQLHASYRDFQSNCWANLIILCQPCGFQVPAARPSSPERAARWRSKGRPSSPGITTTRRPRPKSSQKTTGSRPVAAVGGRRIQPRTPGRSFPLNAAPLCVLDHTGDVAACDPETGAYRCANTIVLSSTFSVFACDSTAAFSIIVCRKDGRRGQYSRPGLG